MPVKQFHYDALLSEYSNPIAAIALLRQHRPYLEMLPSTRRPEESAIVIPLPLVRASTTGAGPRSERVAVQLTCDLAILTCDPQWQVKMGAEIVVFIHRPDEDFSSLLQRWRQVQIWLEREYEWVMPLRYRHVFSESGQMVYPLFVTFSETPDRVRRGLAGAKLPYLVQSPPASDDGDFVLSAEATGNFAAEA